MSNKRRRQRKAAGESLCRPKSPMRLSTGEGPRDFHPETLEAWQAAVPGVELMTSSHIDDAHCLSKARGLAGARQRAIGAVVRLDAIATKYFKDTAIGQRGYIVVLRTKGRYVDHDDPGATVSAAIVFDPKFPLMIESGAMIYWETP